MTIHAPRYALPPHALRDRSARRMALYSVGVLGLLRRPGNIVLISLGATITLLPDLLFLYLSTLGFRGGPSLSTFYEPFALPVLFVFQTLLTTAVGAGIIARDLQTSALTLYLARPLTVEDYVLTKAAVTGTVIGILSVLPGMSVAIIGYLLGWIGATLAAQALGAYLVMGLLMTGFLTGLALLFSTLTERPTFAGAGIFATILLSLALTSVVAGVTHDLRAYYASPFGDVDVVASWIFQLNPPNPLSPALATAILLGITVGGLLVADLRLRGKEVVAP
jgi:ABC-type transport system involved in multi-copper enzyme maturation permease subunit